MIKPTAPTFSTGFTSQGSPYFRNGPRKPAIDSDKLSTEQLINDAIANVIEAAQKGTAVEQKQAADALQELVFALMKDGNADDVSALRERSKEIKETLQKVKVKTDIPDVDLYGKNAELERSTRVGKQLSVDV